MRFSSIHYSRYAGRLNPIGLCYQSSIPCSSSNALSGLTARFLTQLSVSGCNSNAANSNRVYGETLWHETADVLPTNSLANWSSKFFQMCEMRKRELLAAPDSSGLLTRSALLVTLKERLMHQVS